MFVEASEVPPSFLLLLNSFKETPPRLGLVSVHVVGLYWLYVVGLY